MVVLWFARTGLHPLSRMLFEFVLSKLPTTSALDLESATSSDEAKDKAKVDANKGVFFMGDASKLYQKLLADKDKTAAISTISIIRELTWNRSAAAEKAQQLSVVEWSVEELPYRMHSEGVFLVPRAVKAFFGDVMKTIQIWEEALKNKCHKAVMCSVQKSAAAGGEGKSTATTRWNVMRSNETLALPPYEMPAHIQEGLLDPSSSKYAPLFEAENWSAANHLWAERLLENYCSMGFHSDRRLDLCGDIQLYTDYSDGHRGVELKAKELPMVLAGDELKRFLRTPGLRWLEVRTKAAAKEARDRERAGGKGPDKGDKGRGKGKGDRGAKSEHKHKAADSSAQDKDVTFVPMPAGSLLVLTAAANARLQHAIRGQPDPKHPEHESMVLTYRGSNTWLEREDQAPASQPPRVVRYTHQRKGSGAKEAKESRPLQYVRGDKDKFGKWLDLCGRDNGNIESPFTSDRETEAAHWCVSVADLLPPVSTAAPAASSGSGVKRMSVDKTSAVNTKKMSVDMS